MRALTVVVWLSTSTAFAAGGQASPALAHARQLFDARNLDAARAEFAALARATPTDAIPVLYLGKIALSQNDNDEAVRQLEHCVAIEEQNAECHLWLGNALGTSAQHASKFRQPFLARRTKTEFERAVALDPASVDARMGLVQFYMLAPGFMGGSMDKAREQVAEVEKHSKLRGALGVGMLADHDKDLKSTEAAYQRAIVAAPDSAAGYYALVNLLAREKRWNEAFATLDQLIAHVPAEANAQLAVARVALLSGEQLEKGEAAAKKWLMAPPKDAPATLVSAARFRLAALYEKAGKKELARAEYERALTINPKNEDARKALDALRG